jgi:endonuclease-3
MDKASIEQILDLLVSEYGHHNWQVNSSPLSVLIQTILSQNTSDVNSNRAFESLMDSFPIWEDMAAADIYEIATSIRIGGLENIKARRIKQVLGEIQRRRGRLDLDFLAQLPLAEARDWLKQLPGVGTKTANCVFLFSLGKPALPVDTHIFRVAKRLGLVEGKASVEQAYRLLEDLVPPADVYQFHLLTIEHGRKVCKARNPRCSECILQGFCPSYKKFTKREGLALEQY